MIDEIEDDVACGRSTYGPMTTLGDYLREYNRINKQKYYGRTLQQQFDKYTLHSGNIYQIFAYVKNQDKNNTGNVAGLLLYAKTEEAITPDCTFNMGGNQIGAKTISILIFG